MDAVEPRLLSLIPGAFPLVGLTLAPVRLGLTPISDVLALVGEALPVIRLRLSAG